MRIAISLIPFILVMLHTAFSQTDRVKREIESNIDWMAKSTEMPSKLSVWDYPVPIGGGMTSWRGPLSAAECLVNATIFALAGDCKAAVKWLKAGQAHKESVMRLFDTYPSYCCAYIAKYYDEAAVKWFGFVYTTKIPRTYVDYGLSIIRKHHPKSYNDFHNPQERRRYFGDDKGGRMDKN